MFSSLALVAAQGRKSAMVPVSAFTIVPHHKEGRRPRSLGRGPPEPGSQKPAFTNDSVGSNKAL